MVTLSACFEGKVQGVGFRATVLSLAKGYEVRGWVKNLPDGGVELFASGEDSEVEDFLQSIRESHLAGHIDRETILPAPREPELRGFRIVA
ncbi:MAG: acylphosphatase [Verrucomicrobia bacterium]|nr:MAG: acylphosphatase [Verrucomicrobiota bacterium]